jgi:four helix bundle protein
METSSLSNFVTWQKSVRLAADVIKLTQRTSLNRHPWACDQLRRAALSVPSNIAEGYERRAEKDTERFYLIAKGSCAEVLTQIKVAQLADLLSPQEAMQVLSQCEEILRLIAGVLKARRLARDSNTLEPPSPPDKPRR